MILWSVISILPLCLGKKLTGSQDKFIRSFLLPLLDPDWRKCLLLSINVFPTYFDGLIASAQPALADTLYHMRFSNAIDN